MPDSDVKLTGDIVDIFFILDVLVPDRATNYESVKGSLKNKLSILGVESPVLQGVKMQAYREYAEFSQRSRTG